MCYQFTSKDRERFWAKVRKTEGCWEWIGARAAGYGRLRIGRKNIGAHRVSYELHNGSIPDGLHVCHRCDNPICVRPDHLFLGTPAENAADSVAKGRRKGPRTYSPKRALRGQKNPNAKLSDDQVREIRQRYATGTASQEELAFEFGVTRWTIRHITSNKRWKHIPAERSTVERLALNESYESYKLTPSQVLSIRERYAAGLASQVALAAEYGVSRTAIYHIVYGKRWRLLPNGSEAGHA
jgi:DNA-binding XRE family transcriptional regulator